MSGDWSHQTFGVRRTRELLDAGVKRVCFTAPTGAGKSRCMQRMIEWGEPTVVYANRTMLIEQLARGLDDAGIPFGMQVSGYAPSVFENVQIASIQTVATRLAKGRMEPHDASLVIIDEIHNERAERCQKAMEWHLSRGARVVGFTATPVGIGHLMDEMVQAAVNSELFKCGALVPVQTYAPDEPDHNAFKKTTKGLLQLKDEVKEVMLPVICGRVIEHYKKLNPEGKPAIGFAPGVQESRWFTEKFNEAGIPWSHIDGERININGHDLPATRENRMLLLEASKTRRTLGIFNRFVMREAVDLPWLEYMALACTYGSVAAYMQSGGRGMRAYPGKKFVICCDHGGNYYRFDSLNSDRHWSLTDTEKSIKKEREDRFRSKEEAEPIVCPKCAKVRSHGVECPACKFVAKGHRRMVIQTDGTLKEVRGDIYKPRKVNNSPESHKQWKSCVYRCKAKGMNFNQARGLFMKETGTVPGPGFPMVPTQSADWALPVASVPYDRLTK